MTNIKNKGFTIVELLVVIVVIGILASITIISYTGLSQKAVVATLQSDLANASKQIKIFQATDSNNNYPTANNCPTPGLTEICLKSSSGNSFVGGYSVNNASNPKTFVLDATNSTTKYRITESTPPVSVTTTPVTAIASVSGATTAVGNIMTAGALTPGGATVAYQWQSATTVGGTYTDIVGATNSTYTLAISDVGDYLKVVATGTGTYSGIQTSAATAVVSDPNWIAGVAATVLAGKQVRSANLGSTYLFKTTQTAITAPQGVVGIDPSYLSNASLYSPQLYPAVDFSAYPAQNACKAVGGRLANMQELLAIYTNRVAYGNNFSATWYWSATEYNTTTLVYTIDFTNGTWSASDRMSNSFPIRCVAG